MLQILQILHRQHHRPVAAVVIAIVIAIVTVIVPVSAPVWTGACSGRPQRSALRDGAARAPDAPIDARPAQRKSSPRIPARRMPPRRMPPRRMPILRWRYDTVFPITAPPVVLGRTIVFGSTDGVVRALGRTSGELVWRTRLGSPVEGVSVAPGGLLLVGLRDGRLVRLSPDSGAVVWTAHTGAAIRHAPAVSGGLVVVGNDRGHVVALDPGSGIQVWRRRTGRLRLQSVRGGYDSMGISGAPVVARGVVFVTSLDRKIQALDLRTGQVRWQVLLPRLQRPLALVVDKDLLSVTGRCRVVAFRRATGSEVWRRANPACSRAAVSPVPVAAVSSAPAPAVAVAGAGAVAGSDWLYTGRQDGALYAMGPTIHAPQPRLLGVGEVEVARRLPSLVKQYQAVVGCHQAALIDTRGLRATRLALIAGCICKSWPGSYVPSRYLPRLPPVLQAAVTRLCESI